MKDGDKCPSCPGGTLIYQPPKCLRDPFGDQVVIFQSLLKCDWCGFSVHDEESRRKAKAERDLHQLTLGAL
jgi:C4-type Zn-finger protein